MKPPVVSIIVPTFQDSARIVATIESLFKQSFDDFEVIVGDDGSTDDTADVARAACTNDPRVRCIAYSTNVGMTRHWNRLAKEATGTFICKLDGDDLYQPETIQRMVETLRANNASIAFCRTIDCDTNLNPVSSYYGERAFIRYGVEPLDDHQRLGLEWYRLCFDGYQLWHSNAFMVKRQIFKELGGWDVRFGCATDTDFILRLLERNEPVCHSQYAGVLYRRRRGSILDTFRSNSWHRLESAVVHLESLRRTWNSSPKLAMRLQRQWVHYWRLWKSETDEASKGKRDFEQLDASKVIVPPPPFPFRLAHAARTITRHSVKTCLRRK